jgi:hypothetical protein
MSSGFLNVCETLPQFTGLISTRHVPFKDETASDGAQRGIRMLATTSS